jgi:hypothetical protein
MAKSLFQRNTPEKSPPTPRDLIAPEVAHLKRATSVRYGPKGKAKRPLWLVVLAFCGLAWLYLMDPIMHSWYKGEAVRTYLYLHNFGAGPMAGQLVASQILSTEEVTVLNHRTGAFQDYYSSPEAANREAQTIINYMANVRMLHSGNYEELDPVGRMRYLLFIWPGIVVPTQWDFLDPAVGE